MLKGSKIFYGKVIGIFENQKPNHDQNTNEYSENGVDKCHEQDGTKIEGWCTTTTTKGT
jgi:hypothetical protein